MADLMQQLRAHAEEGDALMTRLKYAGTRPDAARYIRALRRWHRDLWPLAAACGVTLGTAGKYYPTDREAAPVMSAIVRPRVVNRHGKICEAQRKMLFVTAAALSRLATHLANAPPIPPKHPGGAPQKDPPKRIAAIADELHEQKRRGERRNKEGAIKAVLKREGFEEGGKEFERAFDRLRKRRTFSGKNCSSR